MMTVRSLLSLTLAALLSACATTQTKPEPPEPTSKPEVSRPTRRLDSQAQGLLRERFRERPDAAKACHPKRGTPGVFDYYLLTLSWSPQHCLHPKSDDGAQCGVGTHFGFIVHGLWPQYKESWPQCCASTTAVPQEIVETAMQVMPSPSLISHEWQKHGTCSGLSVNEYFASIADTFGKITIPELLKAPSEQFTTSADEIRSAFLEANPTLAADDIAVGCEGSALTQVSICLSRELSPLACEANVGDSCGEPGATISVTPVH